MKVKVAQSCLTLSDPMDYTVHGILQARILDWVAFVILPGIFPTQGSKPGLPHCGQILYQLSHKGSPWYGVRKCSNFILLHVAVQFSQHHLLKRLSLPHGIFLPPVSKIRDPQMHGFISGISILFHWSIFLFLCQYHTILMTVALQYNLKSGRLIPPTPFFFLKAALSIWGLLCFHMNFENF